MTELHREQAANWFKLAISVMFVTSLAVAFLVLALGVVGWLLSVVVSVVAAFYLVENLLRRVDSLIVARIEQHSSP